MAFQQAQQRPQALAVPRPAAASAAEQPQAAPLSPGRRRALEESQEWILFSPQLEDGSSRTGTLSTQTPRTATQASEFGSLETRVLSQRNTSHSWLETGGDLSNLGTSGFLDDDEVDDNEGAELDSLDDGLHAFHQPLSASSIPLDMSGGAVLPTHDGQGMFPSPAGLQEHLWQFERHNPQRRRHTRRRSSIQRRLEITEEGELDVEDERTARIEKWRLEQSRAVLEEIERETRRRRRRMSRTSARSGTFSPGSETQEGLAARAASRIDSTIIEEPETNNESFWQRITRRVIQDLIGLDENTLSVIFGEQLPEDPSPTPTQPSPIAAALSQESRVAFNDPNHGWEGKLMERLARELGILLHQFSEHDGAFSTYIRTQQTPDYAGIPNTSTQQRQVPIPQQRRQQEPTAFHPTDSLFMPTIQPALSTTEQSDASVWGVEKEPARSPEDGANHQQREYWEREIDIKMIFSYLKARFAPNSTPSPANGPLPAAWANPTSVTSPEESIRRAEVIRKQHPLVSRAMDRVAAANSASTLPTSTRHQDSLLRRHHVQNLMHKRAAAGSSCASQSTKRSRRSKSGSSSRHYWDLGGSVGSGSGPAVSSGGGGWGEV